MLIINDHEQHNSHTQYYFELPSTHENLNQMLELFNDCCIENTVQYIVVFDKILCTDSFVPKNDKFGFLELIHKQ